MAEQERSAIVDALRALTIELRELDVGSYVPRVPSLTSIEFLRDYVSSNKPVIVTNATSHWPALSRWDRNYLIQVAGDALVTVALTPNGRADCPTTFPDDAQQPTPAQEQRFALPCQRRTTLPTFYKLLDASKNDPNAAVPYLQYQNSSLTVELPQLLTDIDSEFSWASEAFGIPPEAVNFWIGGGKTITSWHRDHYENLYVIISGRKSIRLLPPVDAWRMALKKYPHATWHLVDQDGNEFPDLSDTAPEELYNQVQSGRFILRKDRANREEGSGSGSDDAMNEVLWSSITPQPLYTSNNSNFTSSTVHDVEEALDTQHTESCKSANKGGSRSDNNAPYDAYNGVDLPRPLVVTLHPGEVLYLPSCWWHEVLHEGTADDSTDDEKNDGEAVAVNYWYDMKYDVKYACAKTIEALAVAAGLNEG